MKETFWNLSYRCAFFIGTLFDDLARFTARRAAAANLERLSDEARLLR